MIDDANGHTLISASTKELKEKKSKVSQAGLLGTLIAEKAKKSGIKQAVLNKGSYAYHGRVKAIAEGARKQGLRI